MEGWLKIHRKILDSKQFLNPVDFKIWVWLLCRASYTQRHITLKTGKGMRIVTLERSQLIFGRNMAERELKIDGSTIYKVLQRFSTDNCISIESNNQFSIISINNFDEYQDNTEFEDLEILDDVATKEQPKSSQKTTEEQPSNSQVTATEQPSNSHVTHNKKVNKARSSENKKIKQVKETPDPFYQKCMDEYFTFYKKRTGGPPAINGRDGAGLKLIITFMRNQVKARNPDIDENTEGEKAVQGLAWIFNRWDKLNNYFIQKVSLADMANEINPIFLSLQNPNTNGKQPTGANVSDADLASKVNQFFAAGGKF